MKNFVIPNLDAPTTKALSEYLTQSLEAFSDITGIHVTYFSEDNTLVKEFRKEDKLCNIFDIYKSPNSMCRRNIYSAGQFASRLGEPYIFLCKAGLSHIATALIIDGVYAGYFIAGPIVMGELRQSTLDHFCSLNNLDNNSQSIVNMFAGKMKVFQPKEVSQIALLLYNCIISSVSKCSDYDALRNQYNEQSNVNIDIQHYKKKHVSVEYPYELEQVLIDNVSNGEVTAAKENLKKLLHNFSIIEAGDIEGIKAKTLWFFGIVIRIASKSENNLNQIMDLDLDIINKLSDSESFSELSAVSEQIIETITKNMLSSIYNGKSHIIANALQFINKNYTEKISLKDIEENLHVNSSYFSTLFKTEMGVSFTDYLNSLKVNHACHLLTETNLSIIDVSLSTGFDDQSYFTKVFKKSKGMTPKAYRAEHAKK